MLHSILVVGGNQKSREEVIKKIIQQSNQKQIIEADPDLLIVNQEKKIGIETIREIKKWLSKKNYQKKKRYVLVYQAQNLTIQAQNAFLKTLEEPPVNSSIILELNNSHQLLPTIISRCQVIHLNQTLKINQAAIDQDLINVFKKDLGEQIIFAQEKGRGEREGFLNWLEEQKQALRKKPNQENLKVLSFLDRAERMAEANVSPRLILIYLFL